MPGPAFFSRPVCFVVTGGLSTLSAVAPLYPFYLELFNLQASPGVVTTLDNRMHGLQTGDSVCFKEIVGMEILNGTVQAIKGTMLRCRTFGEENLAESKETVGGNWEGRRTVGRTRW